MLHLPQVIIAIVFLAAFISHVHEAIAKFPPSGYSSFFDPINKHTDAAKPLYSVRIMTANINSPLIQTNLLIDIDAPLTWHDCIARWFMLQGNCPDNVLCTIPVSCDEDFCTEVRNSYSYNSPNCRRLLNTTTSPDRFCPCSFNVNSPVDLPCNQAFLNSDTFYVNITDGKNPIPDYDPAITYAACAPSSSFRFFPANVTGVMSYSSSPYSFVSSLDRPLLNKTFSLCLPSTSAAPGIFFYGNGPYFLRRPHSDVDVRSFLSHTPLLQHPDSFGYFIRVNSIEIKNRSIDIPGNATTKFSTFVPYTTLRTDIYNYVVRRFSLVTKRIPPANPVAPFGLCFKSSTNGTKVIILEE